MTHAVLPLLATLSLIGLGVYAVVRLTNMIEAAAVGVAELGGGRR